MTNNEVSTHDIKEAITTANLEAENERLREALEDITWECPSCGKHSRQNRDTVLEALKLDTYDL